MYSMNSTKNFLTQLRKESMGLYVDCSNIGNDQVLFSSKYDQA